MSKRAHWLIMFNSFRNAKTPGFLPLPLRTHEMILFSSIAFNNREALVFGTLADLLKSLVLKMGCVKM